MPRLEGLRKGRTGAKNFPWGLILRQRFQFRDLSTFSLFHGVPGRSCERQGGNITTPWGRVFPTRKKAPALGFLLPRMRRGEGSYTFFQGFWAGVDIPDGHAKLSSDPSSPKGAATTDGLAHSNGLGGGHHDRYTEGDYSCPLLLPSSDLPRKSVQTKGRSPDSCLFGWRGRTS